MRVLANVVSGFDIFHCVISPTFLNGSLLVQSLARRSRVPVILNIHGIIPVERAYDMGITISPAELWLRHTETMMSVKAASRIVVNTKFMFNDVIRWFGVKPEKVIVIPNGVNVSHFQDCNEHVMLDGDPSVLYVGRLARVKGVDILINAIAAVRNYFPNIKVHFIGHRDFTDVGLSDLIVEKGVEKNAVFHEWIPQSVLPSYYKSADFCVFPSVIESFGIVILEAMASGTPLIASDIAAFKEIISDESTGLFFQNGNVEDLSRKMLRLASDSKLKKQISQKALEAVQAYDWKRVTQQYLSLYGSLIQ